MSAKETKPDTKINPVAVAIGKEINTIRTGLGLNQSNFAEMVGMKQAMISRYEAGHETPGVAGMLKMAMALSKNQGETASIIDTLISGAIKIIRKTEDEKFALSAPKPKAKAVTKIKAKAPAKPKDKKAVKAAKVSTKATARAAALDQPDGKPKRSHSKKATVAVTPDPEPFIDIPPGAPEA